MHEGFPGVTLPGANIFYTNQDATTPARPDGSRLITCHRVDNATLLLSITRAGRYLRRLFPL